MAHFCTNESEAIRSICEWALDLIGVEHRRSGYKNVSVARRTSVAILDEHVGPKG